MTQERRDLIRSFLLFVKIWRKIFKKIGNRIEKEIEVAYAYQELMDITGKI